MPKVEIGKWLVDPELAIRQALTKAVDVIEQPGGRLLYVGPRLGGIGMLANSCLHVVVHPVGTFRGVVVTAIMKSC